MEFILLLIVEPEVEVHDGTKMVHPGGGLKDSTMQKLYLY